MSYKFFYLYLVAGLVAIGMFVYDIVTNPKTPFQNLALEIFPAFFLFYLAYKSYQEKNDQEMM